MRRSRTLTLLLSVAMLALPATSFAQSAGDDQYQDPLANVGGGSHGHTTDTGGGGGSSSSGGSGGGGGSSSAGTPSTSSGSNVSTSGSAATHTPSPAEVASGTVPGQLPRTGFDVILTFELGFAMLLAGLVAQRLIVLRERRDS
jgi:hypothetical protein